MNFFERLLGARRKAEELDEAGRQRLLRVWGLEDGSVPVRVADRPDEVPPPRVDLHYDRDQWHRRVKTVLAGLPDSEEEWEHVVSDARAKDFDPAWVAEVLRQEFTLMIRSAVADRVYTGRERRVIEQARTLIGFTEAEAEAIYQEVVTEAESFFGGPIEEV